ncbi:hypothetical protein M427DRAFT_52802 [Gonapodya prolifera JEL478]|uniref:DUF4139 domain-containing protein n=1 Tax=Gonapodya prolifera (strain JEL478) TaxID=1344416 RepID=A0A139ARL2_GONPJ|nr:hypothetical protein M427DRAFT_52802 [Gonapodya prolifera JEL478]|eukprot:KXS19362.1 hypothetical protein M427DRAFT_52802 [Gonapodya prolifera JEL478]
MANATKVALDAKKDSFVDNVVVFTDRAEVTRIFRNVKIPCSGTVDVVISGVADLVADSLRVEGHAKGCMILDVTYATEVQAPESSEDETVADGWRKKIADLENKKSVLQAEGVRVTKQMQMLESYGTENIKSKGPLPFNTLEQSPAAPARPFSQDSLNEFDTFLRFYGKAASEFDVLLNELQLKVTDVEKEISAATQNLSKAQSASTSLFGGPVLIAQKRINTITVVLESEGEMEAELKVSYVVFNASWKPKYDLRVSSITEKKLKIHYRAEIRQATGEDWDNVQLSLSTATPVLGGDAPEPTKWTVSLRSNIPPPTFGGPPAASFRSTGGFAFGSAAPVAPQAAYTTEAYQGQGAPMMQQMSHAVARVEGGVTSATYSVAARTTVPCDNVLHKVTVALIDVGTTFLHFAYPKSASYAFLKAKVVNNSEYALLYGPASVFLDDNFVAKSTIKNVSSQETFEASLGVDPSIRVSRRPVVKTKETSGLLSRFTTWKYTQAIDVRNTKKMDAKIVVVESVPWSGDEKIKIALIEPVTPSQVTSGSTPGERQWLARKASDGNLLVTRDEELELRLGEIQSRLNTDTNCVEWVMRLGAGQSVQLKLQFSITTPQGEELNGV